MLRIRLTRPPLAAYRFQRRVSARTVAGFPWVSDDQPTPSLRAIRNIRRKGKRLRLSPLRLGQRRAPQWRVIYGFPFVSDARPAQASIEYRNARAYMRRRPR